MAVPFTLYEAIAAYLYDCWGGLHEAASTVPIAHAGGKKLGVFCLDYSLCHCQNLRWLSLSYTKALQSAKMPAVRRMCQQVICDLLGDRCTAKMKTDMIADLQDEVEELLEDTDT